MKITTPPARVTVEISWKTILKISLFVAGIAIGFYIRNLLLLILLTFILSVGLDQLVKLLQKKTKLPRIWAITLILTVFFSTVGLVLYFTLQSLVDETLQLTQDLPGLINEVLEKLGLRDQFTAESDEQLVSDIQERLSAFSGTGDISNNVLQIGSNILSGFLTLVTLGALTFYQLNEPDTVREFIVGFFPKKNEKKVRAVFEEVELKLGNWLIGQGVMMTLMGLFAYVGFSIFGLEFALPLAIIAGVMDVIPIVGPVLAAFPIAIVAVATLPLPQMIGVGVYYLFLQIVEGNILVPRVMKQSVGLDPIIVIISIMIGSQLLGVLGALLAIPVSAIIMILYHEWHQTMR